MCGRICHLSYVFYTVTLGSPSGEFFRGFQVRAHKFTGDQEDIIGQFVDVPDVARPQFWYPDVDGENVCIDCLAPPRRSVSHNENSNCGINVITVTYFS